MPERMDARAGALAGENRARAHGGRVPRDGRRRRIAAAARSPRRALPWRRDAGIARAFPRAAGCRCTALQRHVHGPPPASPLGGLAPRRRAHPLQQALDLPVDAAVEQHVAGDDAQLLAQAAAAVGVEDARTGTSPRWRIRSRTPGPSPRSRIAGEPRTRRSRLRDRDRCHPARGRQRQRCRTRGDAEKPAPLVRGAARRRAAGDAFSSAARPWRRAGRGRAARISACGPWRASAGSRS